MKWWDGYSGQDTVVLDDFKDYAMPLADLQRLLDWYPLWVEVKGGSVLMLAKRYVITANNSPSDWYIRTDKHRTIERRVADFAGKYGRLIECVPGWVPPEVGVILEPNPADERLPGGSRSPGEWRTPPGRLEDTCYCRRAFSPAREECAEASSSVLACTELHRNWPHVVGLVRRFESREVSAKDKGRFKN